MEDPASKESWRREAGGGDMVGYQRTGQDQSQAQSSLQRFRHQVPGRDGSDPTHNIEGTAEGSGDRTPPGGIFVLTNGVARRNEGDAWPIGT